MIDSSSTSGANRPVAQVGQDPRLVAFGEEVRRQGLMPGWDFQGGQVNEPVPAVKVPQIGRAHV